MISNMSYVLNAQKGMPKFVTGTHGNPNTKTANTFSENVVLNQSRHH
jgi:hypothetical protein